MKNVPYSLRLLAALGVAIALFILTLPAKPEPVQPAVDQTGGGIALQPPAFLKSAYAADSTATISAATQVDFSFLLDEAGVAAYTKLEPPLDLASLEPRFKTIRQQTDQFISGIVIVPGYEKRPEFSERSEVQVFVHRDGWIIGYLTKYQPASALFDWVNYEEERLTSTLLENVVRTLALDTGSSGFNVSYYDFRYPTATNLLLAADRAIPDHSESFEINIPRGLTVYESSWSHSKSDWTFFEGACSLDDGQLSSIRGEGGIWGIDTGELTQAKFSLDKTHTLTVTGGGRGSNPPSPSISYCGVAIIYREVMK